MNFKNKPWRKIKELISYGVWGIITTAINLFLFYLFVRWNMHYMVANIISYGIAVVLSYYFNRYLVFEQSELEAVVTFIRFIVVRLMALGIDSVLLFLCVSVFELNIMISKIFISGLIILATYIVNKLYVFQL